MLLSRSTRAQSSLLSFIVALQVLLIASPASQSGLVHATDLPPASAIDPISQPILQAGSAAHLVAEDGESRGDGNAGYAPEFDYFDRNLRGRQEPQQSTTTELKENERKALDISPGTTAFFVLKQGQSRLVRMEESDLEALEARGTDNTSDDLVANTEEGLAGDNADDQLEKRQAASSIWVSANTCRQPNPPPLDQVEKSNNNPQLVMYISTSSRNQRPGPTSTDDLATPPMGLLFENGFASYALQANSDVYIGISAPNLDNGWFGSWNFELAVSSNGFYHSYDGADPFLYMIDTDSDSALFITYNLSEANVNDTDKWMRDNPFKMYAFEDESITNITGLERSMCAVQYYNQSTNVTMETSITTKFGGDLPKAQFHLQGLKAGKKYNGFLAVGGQQDVLQLPGNTTVRGGGMVFQQFDFTTKADDNCQVIFDLEFCDSVAYAVPSNPDYKDDDNKLKALYDDQAKAYYRNFSNSIAQVACDTYAEAQYSLARTCRDCERDYKNWLCSVLIPRCEDWNATGDFLQERNVNMLLPDGGVTFEGNVSAEMNATKRDRLGFNSTRNPGIDKVTPLGPYKEMKPCEDLCFDIVRSCPAQLGFACPNNPARGLTYGKRDPDDKELRCNFPGAVVKLNILGGAGAVGARMGLVVGVVMMVVMSSW
ncbi:hypothetical protein HBI23_048330 [Parastagonospora nodorum]|nr:hypothetical protein HBI95_002150 [Parastagonospora nodorum]KAH5336236.1 hypothetical protein HBI12_030350 [Parastagonospora nodorum]KAH5454030.1 hypothetical protein HBI47_013110 [Parastagonospora nodorum]KAH5685797.1 hypothetical protein HBI23_048330 [Parastagonospora nodorum]